MGCPALPRALLAEAGSHGLGFGIGGRAHVVPHGPRKGVAEEKGAGGRPPSASVSEGSDLEGPLLAVFSLNVESIFPSVTRSSSVCTASAPRAGQREG